MNFYKFKQQQKQFYKSIGKVYSPALKAEVHFSSDGFHHLIYETPRKNTQRGIKEQALKLNCLSYVPLVVSSCQKAGNVRLIRQTRMVELIGQLGEGLKIRVIIRKVSHGNYHFFSVMPHDKESRGFMSKQKAPPK